MVPGSSWKQLKGISLTYKAKNFIFHWKIDIGYQPSVVSTASTTPHTFTKWSEPAAAVAFVLY